MGACRENRLSENTLSSIILSVRNLDKLLWHGQKWAVQDVEEYASCIKRDLDEMVRQFKKEVGHEDPPTDFKCGCCSQSSIEDLLRPIGDKVNTPPTQNILGDKDWPCSDSKCDCHKE